MEVVLTINNISKHYGRIKAVDNLSLCINKGDVFGILGPNGSGKTTLLCLVLDLIKPTFGHYKWFNQPLSNQIKKRMGILLETPNFYPYLNAIKNLEIIANIKNVPYSEVNKVLDIVKLSEWKKNKFNTFSLGMKQRLSIAAALMGNPEVLILDEPTNGLDPQGIAEIRNIIKEISKKGITIILASHLLDEVQKICSHVAILKKGQKLYSGSVNEVLKDSLIVEVSGPDLEAIIKTLNEFDKVEEIKKENNILLVKLKENTSSVDLNKYLFEKNIQISQLNSRKKSLENYFLELLTE